eukprot:1168806-Amphidinium_carterae.1
MMNGFGGLLYQRFRLECGWELTSIATTSPEAAALERAFIAASLTSTLVSSTPMKQLQGQTLYPNPPKDN